MFVGGVLDGGGLGEEADGTLARGVGGVAGPEADDARDGRDVDDGAAASVADGGYRRLCAEKDALGVDVKRPVPTLQGSVLQPASRATDTGVVDEDVEPAVAVEGGLHGGIPVVGAGYIEVEVGRVAAEFGYLRFNLPAFVVEQVADDYFCALPGEENRLRSALSARAAAYECYLAV